MTEAIDTPNTSRRALLAAGTAIPSFALVSAPAAAATSPDAELIDHVKAFIASNMADDAACERFTHKPRGEWTAEEVARWDASCAWNTGYHEKLAVAASAEPTTLEGVTAQALAVAYHFRFEGDTDEEAALTLALAHSVLRLSGTPLPVWPGAET